MSGRLTGENRRLAMAWLGPWLVGGCLDLLLQGILFCQFVNYFTHYRDDKRTLQIVVAILFMATFLKSVQAFAIVWIQSIVFFGDLNGAILLNYTTWWQSGNPLMVALMGFYVQSYFCFRLWVISKKWYVVAPVATIFLFAFLSMVVATYFITTADGPKISAWCKHLRTLARLATNSAPSCRTLSSVFAGDITLSFLTAFFLLKSKKNVLPQTVGLISALVRLTFQTAAPAALCAMFNLIFSQVNPGGSGITSTAFNMALPKLYAVSMMWTLNARRTIRASHSSRGMTTSSNEISGGRSRAQRRPGDMELGVIQVLTQTETTQHIDVRDMFDPTQNGDAKRGHGQGPAQVDTKKSDDDSVHYSK
ncbi:hypothetical protein B0H17DRAFT_1210691 [Mycena rosella]|uniref:DUF6534 domain-containing protein n=1 Tax=Mycena rosella TaxID=1033263 RepID=A0AAD7G4C7_MYCRO|nr:hypothetical protein B0H17DRAFT_1210691 [Mycena rosella]